MPVPRHALLSLSRVGIDERRAREWIGDGPSISLAARPSTRGPPPRSRGLRHNEIHDCVSSSERSVSREARAGAEVFEKPSGDDEDTSSRPSSAHGLTPGVTGVGHAAYRLPPVRAG